MDYKNALGYHVYGDIKHDFGTPAKPAEFYNYNGVNAVARAGATGTSEDAVVDFFMKGAGTQFVNNLAARKAGEIVFTVPEKTANFQKWIPPLLYQGGNDKIGIIQDAGEFITQRIGAKNVITFGSILDPAGKPVAPYQDPIWYDPGADTTLVIPLEPFGFDSNIISALRITKLTAGTVNATYILKDGKEIDAVAMNPPAPAVKDGKGKRINKTEVEFSGFFTSIDKVSKIEEQLSLAGITDKNVQKKLKTDNLVYFYIGKTLGDASLVASGLPDFHKNDMVEPKIPNPYYGIGNPGWKNWVSGASVQSPTILALKTGDRLNHIRAIIMDLPSIYEQQAKGGKLKEYVFFPGIGDPEAVKKALLDDFDKIRRSAYERYRDLWFNLETLLDESGTKIKKEYTSFAPGGAKVITKPMGELLAAKLINQVMDTLLKVEGEKVNGICGTILNWVDKRKETAKTISNNAQLRDYYEQTLQITNSCLPQTTSISVNKIKQEPYLLSKLIVANVPQKNEDWPIHASLDISLRNAFDSLNGAQINTDDEYDRRLVGKDIMNRFFSRIIGQQGGGMKGGAETPLDITATIEEVVGEVEGVTPEESATAEVPDEMSKWEYVVDDSGQEKYVNTLDNSEEIYIDYTDENIPYYTNSKDPDDVEPSWTLPWENQTGGAYLSITFNKIIKDTDSLNKMLESFPRTKDFIEYMKTHNVLDKQFQFLSIYDVIRRRNTDRVLDNMLVSELLVEFLNMMGKIPINGSTSTPYITMPRYKEKVFKDGYVHKDRNYYSNTPTLLFNAYVASIDAENSLYADIKNNDISETITQSTVDFQALEKAFLDKIPKRFSRANNREVFVFQPFEQDPEPQQSAGGSQTRRPLYH